MDDETFNFEPDQAIVLEAPAPTTHRIDIEPIMPVGLNRERQLYRVTYRGEVLLDGVWEPEYKSCRALVAKGLKGRLEVWGGKPSKLRGMIRDIEKGAKLTIIENEYVGPRLARYVPHPNAIARSQSLNSDCRGCPASKDGVQLILEGRRSINFRRLGLGGHARAKNRAVDGSKKRAAEGPLMQRRRT
jgi:hypothetical protein